MSEIHLRGTQESAEAKYANNSDVAFQDLSDLIQKANLSEIIEEKRQEEVKSATPEVTVQEVNTLIRKSNMSGIINEARQAEKLGKFDPTRYSEETLAAVVTILRMDELERRVWKMTDNLSYEQHKLKFLNQLSQVIQAAASTEGNDGGFNTADYNGKIKKSEALERVYNQLNEAEARFKSVEISPCETNLSFDAFLTKAQTLGLEIPKDASGARMTKFTRDDIRNFQDAHLDKTMKNISFDVEKKSHEISNLIQVRQETLTIISRYIQQAMHGAKTNMSRGIKGQ